MENRAKIEFIRGQYQHGQISLDEAKLLVQPILDDINQKAAKIAKAYGKRFKKITFGYVFR